MSVGQCIALLKAEVERKLTSALIIFSACPRFESRDPALVNLKRDPVRPPVDTAANRPAAAAGSRTRSHTGIISEQCF